MINFEKINQLIQQNKFLDAQKLIKNLLNSDERNQDLLLQLAGIYRSLGKFDKAKETYIKITQIDETNTTAHRLLIDYLEKEVGIKVHYQPKEFTFNDRLFFIGHGDGLGPEDKGYKRMKKIFTNPFFQWCFRWLHPDLGMRLGHYLSVKNKLISGEEDAIFLGEDKEWLAQYAKRKYNEKARDYFVFGHRHIPLDIAINDQARYINLGDWITHFTYAEFSENTMALKKWEN